MVPLIITPLFPPAIGGAATHFGQVAPIIAQNPDVERLIILTEKMPGQPKVYETGKLVVHRRLPLRLSEGQRPFFQHALSYLETERWFAFNLEKFVDNQAVDLVHFHTRYAGPFFRRSLEKLTVPRVADSQDKMSDSRALAQYTQAMVCCGEGVLRFAVDHGYPEERTFLVPNPFKMPARPNADARAAVRQKYQLGDRPYLLFVGDITPNKGVYELLDGFKLWKGLQPEVNLVLVGVNRERAHFLDRIAPEEKVIYLGHIPNAEIPALMCEAAIVILPSKSEGLPRVMLEALAMGSKVVAPPSIPEFDRHISEFVVPEISATSIAATLDRVWHAPTLPNYPLENHRIDRVVGGVVDVYRKILID